MEGRRLTLYHCTPRRNLRGIRRGGIDPAYARSNTERSYYVTAGAIDWAIPHVAMRHGVDEREVIVLECRVPRKWLTRFRRGVWYATRILPPERITNE